MWRSAARIAIKVMLGGIAITVPTAAIAGVAAYASIADSMPRVKLPAEVELRLSSGEYRVYGEGSSVNPSDCTLTGPDGRVELRRVVDEDSYTIGDITGIAQFEFEAPNSGSYRLACNESLATLAILRTQPSNGTVMLVGFVTSIAAGLIAGAVVAWRHRREATVARTGRPTPGTPGTTEETRGLPGSKRTPRSLVTNSTTLWEEYERATTRRTVRTVIMIAIVAALATVTAVATVTIVTDQGEVVASGIHLR
jgi:hypothetical protein